MNTDNYFVIGHGHEVCEDFTRSGIHENLAYAIVSDGCSAGKDSNIGSMMIALAAEQAIKSFPHYNMNPFDTDMFVEYIKNRIQNSILHTMIPRLGVQYENLFATLMIAIYHADNPSARVIVSFGDGVVAIEDVNGVLNTYTLEYESGAPYYLIYGDEDQGYKDQFPGQLSIQVNRFEADGEHSGGHNMLVPANEHPVFSFEGMENPVKQISLFSDGIVTFFELGGSNPVDNIFMPRIFTRFKTTQGSFVRRRMIRELRDQEAKLIKHFDDVSMATIWIEDKVDNDEG